MKILILNTSPRKSFSTSVYLSKILKLFLAGSRVEILPAKSEADRRLLLQKLPQADVLIFALPVYVDSVPSTLLQLLQQLEGPLAQEGRQLSVYALANCGFYEGHQCALALDTLRLWCQSAKVDWRGGLGIGGGVMLGFIRLLPALGAVLTLLQLAIKGAALAAGGLFTPERLWAGWLPINLMVQTGLWLLFTMGGFAGLWRLRGSILNSRDHRLQYTTVWFCPRFLFVWMASLYWVVRALVQYGTPPWKLAQQPDWPLPQGLPKDS